MLKPLTSPANLQAKRTRIELGDEVNAGVTGKQIGPGFATVLPTGLTQPRPVTTTRRDMR
jgi:hypothetical protein